MLEAYLRTRGVLLDIVFSEEFSTILWDCRSQTERDRRTNGYVKIIESGEFFHSVKELHNVFRIMRTYLRKFDGDDARIYHVVRETNALENHLKNIPVTDFMTAERKAEIMAVFESRKTGNRREGGGRINATLIQDVHLAAFLLDPEQSPADDTMYEIRLLQLISAYFSGSGTSEEQEERMQDIFVQYKSVRAQWENERDDPLMRTFLRAARRYPLLWWKRLRSNMLFKDVCEFALRVLSASPSSCSVERSFSLQKRIRTDARNLMDSDKVRKLVYCHWNGRLTCNASAMGLSDVNVTESLFSEEMRASLDGSEDESPEICNNRSE